MENARIAGMDENLQPSVGSTNLLVLGLLKVKGHGGLNGWRWIFVIVSTRRPPCVNFTNTHQEGLITVVLGIGGYVAIMDCPDKAHKGFLIKKPFLTRHGANFIMERIDCDRGDATFERLFFSSITVHLKDWKLWEFAWLFLLNNIVTLLLRLFPYQSFSSKAWDTQPPCHRSFPFHPMLEPVSGLLWWRGMQISIGGEA